LKAHDGAAIMAIVDVHENQLVRSVALLSFWRKKVVSPLDVIAVLNKAKIPFVLIGAYGLAGWMKQARATEDVDVVVASKHLNKTVNALAAAFPDLEQEHEEVVVRFRERDSQVVVIDVVKPTQPHLRAIFKNTIVVGDKQMYRIPNLEMALVLKYAPMISPNRPDEKKHQDAHDFIVLVKQNPNIDEAKLALLGELVYVGGGQEVLEMIQTIRAGKNLRL
jgi:hypothetical protein